MINRIIVKIIGYILLSPALIYVLLFMILFFAKRDIARERFSENGKGYDLLWVDGGEGYTSALFCGLMAIAGAYLIKDNSNK